MTSATLSEITDRILYQLIEYYFSEQDFYLTSSLDKLFKHDEEAAFIITNDDIIENLRKKLDDKYYLQVDNVMRTLTCHDPKDNFQYADIKLEIKRKEDDD